MSPCTSWLECCLLSFLVVLLAKQGCAQDTSNAAGNGGEGGSWGLTADGDDDKCLPEEAENCFADVNTNLQCLMTSSRVTCKDKSASQLCSTIDDSLNCTYDVLDYSCTPNQRRKTLETWLKGLRAVRKELCSSPKQRRTFQDLISNPQCWNILDFLECMEVSAGIVKVSDMMKTSMTSEECTKLLVGAAMCNARAERRRRTCKGRTEAVNNALTTFFITTPCFNTHLISVESPGMSAAGGAMVTLVVMVVVFAAVAFFLTKRNIITVDTKFRLREDSEQLENGSAY